jgi:hypothetical protein
VGQRLAVTVAAAFALAGAGNLAAWTLTYLGRGGTTQPAFFWYTHDYVQDELLMATKCAAAAVWLGVAVLIWWTQRRKRYVLIALAGTAVSAAGSVGLCALLQRWPQLPDAAQTAIAFPGQLILVGIAGLSWFWAVRKVSGRQGTLRVDCPNCGRDVSRVGANRCPHCGQDFAIEDLVNSQARRVRDLRPLTQSASKLFREELSWRPPPRPPIRRTVAQRLAPLSAVGLSVATVVLAAYVHDVIGNRFFGYGDTAIGGIWLVAISVLIWIWLWAVRQRHRRRAVIGEDGLAQVNCVECGYNMLGLREPRCPECGRLYTIGELIAAQQYGEVSDGDLPGAGDRA